MQTPKTKDELVEELVQWQFQVDPDIIETYRFYAKDEDAPGEPLKLLFLSSYTEDADFVSAFRFNPTPTFPYPQVFASVSPRDFERLMSGEYIPPLGFDLKTMQRQIRKPKRETKRSSPKRAEAKVG